MVELDLGQILMSILEKYGIVGFALVLNYFYFKMIDEKMNTILNLNNRTFGVMLSIVDKEKRASLNSRGDENG